MTANVSGKAGEFGSEPVSVIVLAVSCAVVTDWAFAVGFPTTVIETVAGLLVWTPLLTVNWKLSDRSSRCAGVYVRFGAVPESVPWAGLALTANPSDSGGVFGSEPVSVMTCGGVLGRRDRLSVRRRRENDVRLERE